MYDVDQVSTVQALFEVAKAQKMGETMWGKNVRIRNVMAFQGRREGGQVVEEIIAYTLDSEQKLRI